MAPTNESTALPLAADRAILSNRISLLLSSQSSVLKTMTPQSRPSTTTKRPRIDDEDDLFKGTRLNDGLGYIPDKKVAPVGNTKEDRFLRGGLKGKGKQNGKAKWKEESESEEETGRSALGKRKRPRREVVPETEDKVEDQPEEANEEDKEDTKMDDTPNETMEVAATKDTDASAGGEKKKRKKKKKKCKAKDNV